MSKGTESGPPVVVWFRQDLRLQDHAALQIARASGRAVLPVYVLDDDSHMSERPLRPAFAGLAVRNDGADLPQARQRALDVHRATVRRVA